MAPITVTTNLDTNPLADYFFISGIESSQVLRETLFIDTANPILRDGAITPSVDATIEENEVLETDIDPRPRSTDLDNIAGDLSGRRSRLSLEARKSVGSIGEARRQSATPSNRSSATIKGPPVPGNGLTDAEFESALRKFANERESFIEEIQYSAGAIKSSTRVKKPGRPKTQRIISDEAVAAKTGVGSLKRRLSTMSSLKRQPSTMGRQTSVRTSKRLSGYNSVIPNPQPFHQDPNMHPLKRRYEPVLLDRYPQPDMASELKRRDPFPDYVPMFAFPNDVSVVSSDEQPKSTWHAFAMTSADSSKIYGLCLTVWVPLNPQAADDLERQCEEWRKANMTQEERELAGSLGERVAAERTKLSKLLLELPTLPAASEEREDLEEEIGEVEERIALITEMLHPIRHGAASKIEGLTESETGLWIPRAYGVMGRDGSMTGFWKEWLKAVITPMTNGAIMRVPPSSPRIGMWQPLERYVINLCV
ncbi:MAG: hypothetical protein INR71_13045, partial [Terriglobus roseus]|nr:hypothetical protein [Terriglobus roseus]